ncbi:hypothetical protein EYZ11_009655 [Aspergillus tanneri]|nr:hypothetical protein EYZ11_009655 [Aspergillus tanneri]
MSTSGKYQPPRTEDLRAPCPALNTLANHGLIARDGRNITANELTSALRYLGLGFDVITILVNSAFAVHAEDPKNSPPGTSWSGLRDPNQVNDADIPVLNLDQVGRPHAIEHDVSLTRQDRALGDHMHLDRRLYDQLLRCPRDASPVFRVADLGILRNTRYNQQKMVNSQLEFDTKMHYIACAEAAALHCVFGKGMRRRVPREYIKAVFGEERLPIQEGWKPRRWRVFLPELAIMVVGVSRYAWPF